MKKTIFSRLITLLIVFGLLLGSLPGESFALAKDSSLPKAQADLSQTSANIMLTGTVYDGGIEGGDKHGYPLYAKITLTADGESQVLYTDPVTGTYAVPIQSAVDYTIRVEAVSRGYTVVEESFSATATLVRDFHLSILGTCTAPGYKPDYAYFYDFEGSDEGFTYVRQGADVTWAWGEFTSGPNHAVSGNKGIATNPDGLYGFHGNGYAVSPIIDLSIVPEGHVAYIDWWEWVHVFSLPDQTPPTYTSIQFSRNGGSTWQNVWGERSRRQDENFQKRRLIIDSSYYVSNFQFRYYFTEGNPSLPVLDDGWYIDDIGIDWYDPEMFAPTPIYDFHFDSADEAQWTTEPPDPNQNSWEQGVPTTGPQHAHSDPNVWATNLDGRLQRNEYSHLTSPVLDFSDHAGKSIVVSFWDWLDTVGDIYLSVSNDGGQTFHPYYHNVRPKRSNIGGEYVNRQYWLDPKFSTDAFQWRFTISNVGAGTPLWGWYIDDVSFGYSDPIGGDCVKENGSLVTGYVLDQIDPDIKIVDASIESNSANARTLARAEDSEREGLYYFFQPLDGGSGDVDLRISKYRYSDTEETLTLNSGSVLSHNFYLSAGWLIPESANIERTIFLDDDDETLNFELLNQGTLDVSWLSSKTSVGFDPLAQALTGPLQAEPITILPNFNMDSDNEFNETGSDENFTFRLLPTAAKYGITQAPAAIAGYESIDFYFRRYESLGNFENYTDIGPVVDDLWHGDFLGDDYDTIYAMTNPRASSIDNFVNEFYAINTKNGEATFIGELKATTPIGYYAELTEGNGFFYSVVRRNRYEESILTRIDPFGGVVEIARYLYPDQIRRLAYVSSEKMLYTLSSTHLERINPETGEKVKVGLLEAPYWYIFLAYDKGQDNLYLVSRKSNNIELYIIDRETAETELVAMGQLSDTPYPYFLAIEAFGDNPVDEVPWLEIGIRRGKTLAGESSTLDLGFKVRDVIEQPGDYHAELTLINDTPRGDITIPITLHVLRPYSWGNFKGTVTGGEQCDLNPVPLPGAEIRFYRDQVLVKNIYTDENGYFSYALEKGNYDIEIVYPSYVNYRIENIRLGPSEDLLFDIPMRHDSACLSWEPAMPFATQYADELSLQTLTLRNTGARGTEIVLEEILGEGAFAIDLNLDDGSAENSVSLGGAVPMVWLNRFTPDAESFPFWLESVEVFWPKNTGLELNDLFDIVVYQNKVSNHDPALGGEFLYKQRVSASKLGAFENYVLNEPILLEGPGDIIIGFISLETPCNPNLPCYWPAAIDMDSSQQRSWLGTWGAEVPEIPTLPPLGFWMVMDDAGLPSNFLVRGYGITADNLQDVPWVTLGQESGFIERDGGTFETELLFDSTGMSWGDYDAQVRVSNAPDPRVYVPVKLRVLPFNMMYLPLIQVFYTE